MKIILCEDVEHVGVMGETVNVAPGYARNYLIPRKLAVLTESASAKQVEHELAIIRRREEKRKAQLTLVAKQLDGVTVELQMRAGEEDKLFGSVTSAMIAEKLAEMGHSIDRKMLHLTEPIKTLGIFTVPVKLGSGVTAEIKVWVSNVYEEPAPVESE
jgi:large subunit ribosomal protein L9